MHLSFSENGLKSNQIFKISIVVLVTFSSDSSLIKAFEQVPNALLAQLANASMQ
jgi:hypothetical protein